MEGNRTLNLFLVQFPLLTEPIFQAHLNQKKKQELDEEKNKQKDRLHKLNFSMIIVLSVIASATTMRIALLDDDIVRRAGFLFLSLLLLGLIAGGLYYMARRFIERLSSDRISSLEREFARYEIEEQKLEE